MIVVGGVSVFTMRSLRNIGVLIVACAIMLALVLTVTGGMALEVPPEAEGENTQDGVDWAHKHTARPVSLCPANSKSLWHGRAFAACYQNLSLYHLHVLLI